MNTHLEPPTEEVLGDRPRGDRPGHQSIVAFNDRNNVIYLGKRDSSTVAFLKPHRFGLELTIRRPGEIKSYKRYVIPGEVPKSRAVAFICSVVPRDYTRNADNFKKIPLPWVKDDEFRITVNDLSHQIDIGKVLESSGFWAKRGRMDPHKRIPRAFFQKYPVKELARGRHTSIQAWWKDHLTRHNFGHDVGLSTYEYPGGTPTYDDQRELAHAENVGRHRSPSVQSDSGKPALRPVQALARVRRYAAYVETRQNVSRLIDLGLVPESPTAIRKFDKIQLNRLRKYLENDLHRSKAFARFITNVAPTFDDTLDAHNWINARGRKRPVFERLVDQLEKLPKSQRSLHALNAAINAGMTVAQFNLITNVSVNALEEITRLKTEMHVIQPRYQRRTLNENYCPPTIPLEPGWKFADHESFRKLSNQYSICISNGFGYEDRIVQGHAHVLFREDHKTLGGAVAFLEYSDGIESRRYERGSAQQPPGWAVVEIRGFANAPIDQKYDREARIAAKTLSKMQPAPSPIVEQLAPEKRDERLTKLLTQLEAIAPGCSNEERPRVAFEQTLSLSDEARHVLAERKNQPQATKAPRRHRHT